MARTAEEEDTRTRRWKFLASLGLGALAVGVPAAVVRRRNQRPPSLQRHGMGRAHTWSWRGIDISFDRLGQGVPLVLLHSMGPGHDGREWHAAAEILARDFDLWIPDLPGWGRSASPDFDPGIEPYLAFIDDFLAQVVAEPAIVIGVGRSAGYAVEVASLEPGFVRALGLVNPWGLGRPPAHGAGARVTRQLAGLPVLRPSAVTLLTSRRAVRRHLEEQVFAAPERVDAGVLDHYTCSARQPGVDRSLATLMTGHLDPAVAETRLDRDLPVWLAWGRRCQAPAVESADLWLRSLPMAELDVFDDSGLLPHLEEADRFARRFRAFIDQHNPSP